MNKRIISLLALVCLMAATLFATGCTGKQEISWAWKDEPKAKSTGVTINVYNWGEYIAEDTVAAFEHITGIKVNYSTFDENETMYTRLASGAVKYDVVIPSDYMIGKLIDEDMLLPLNFANIPNAKFIQEDLLNPVYDATGAYSVPYTWGTVGIFYNSKHVDGEDVLEGWDLLWNEEYKDKIVMFSNPRDAFGIALKKLGYSMNTENPAEWAAAYEELKTQKKLVYRYAMDEVFDQLIGGSAWIAPYYAGDSVRIMDAEEGNPDVKFFFPAQGTNRFVDAMCVPKGATHQKEAELFINFMCRTEVAKANAEYIGYSTPQTEALQQLDPEIAQNPTLYPSQEVLDKAEPFLTLPQDVNDQMTQYWQELMK